MNPKVKARVVFRVWNLKRRANTTIALFPEIYYVKRKINGDIKTVRTFENGKFGSLPYTRTREQSRYASPSEYKDLKDELERLGYEVKAINQPRELK